MRAALASRAGAGHRGQVSFRSLPATGLQSWHRASGTKYPVAPENSRSAVAYAIANGAHIIDLDCRQTNDGVQVLIHDPTTAAMSTSTVTVASTNYASLPQLNKTTLWGSGWAAENIPKLADILAEFGGQVCFTVETKLATTAHIDAIAAIIRAYGLQDSVFINTSSNTLVSYIKGLGLLAHMFGITDATGITNAAAAGADLIELPYNVSTTLRDQALATSIFRTVAAPIGTRAEYAARTSGLHGFVSDSPLYVERTARRLTDMSTVINSGKRGAGMFINGSVTDYLTPSVLKLQDGAASKQVQLGDVSGTVATTGSITMKFRMTTLPTTTTQSVRFRLMCPEEGTTAQDTNTRGYVCQLRANGDIGFFSSNNTVGGAATTLSTAAGPDLVAGTEYTLLFEWTATTVRLRRFDGATQVVDSGTITNSDWRSPFHYALTTMTTGVATMDDDSFSITEP